MYLLLQIFILFIFISYSAYYDSKINIVNHTSRWIFRFIFVLILSLFNYKVFFLLGSIFYGLFDYMYNIYRNNSLFYIGKTAYTDKFKRKYFGKYLTQLDLIHKIIIIALCTILKVN